MGLTQGPPPRLLPGDPPRSPPCPGSQRSTGIPSRWAARGNKRGSQLESPAPSPPPHCLQPLPALWAPPPRWSGSRRSPPRLALPRVQPALQRHALGRSALLVAAGSAGDFREPPAAQPLGTQLPQRPSLAQTSPWALAGSACGQHRIWGGGGGGVKGWWLRGLVVKGGLWEVMGDCEGGSCEGWGRGRTHLQPSPPIPPSSSLLAPPSMPGPSWPPTQHT